MKYYFKNNHGILYQGDNRDVLPSLADNSVDLMVTDPPYGLVSPGSSNAKGGFMGKKWDKAVPPVATWKECLRVLKPGAFAFVMCIPRQDCQAKMIVNVEEAGFDVSFTSLLHTYGTGFPKAQNVSRMLDKRLGMEREVVGKKGGRYSYEASERTASPMGNVDPRVPDWGKVGNLTAPASPEAKELDGSYSNFSPKPAIEFALVVRKPFTDKHRRSDVHAMLGGKYDYWYTAKTEVTEKNIAQVTEKWGDLLPRELVEGDVIERRLALIAELSDEVILNRREVLKSKPFKDTDITSSITHALATRKGISWLEDGRIPYDSGDDMDEQKAKNPHTVHANDDVFGDYSMCKDEWTQPQGRFAPNLLVSGDVLNDGRVLTSGLCKHQTQGSGWHGTAMGGGKANAYKGDSGSYSRYFSLDAWSVEHLPESVLKTYPFFIVPKPSSKEKNSGLDGRTPEQVNDGRESSIDNPYQRGDSLRRNTHTTVKSLTLMAYLITIGSRPGDIILDPFSGSGSTLIAAALLHRPFIGMELEDDYCDITERRLWHFTQHRDQMDFDILLNGKSP